jgi:signal transduction histidine kinase
MDDVRGLAALDAWARRRPWVSDAVLAAVLAALVLPAGVAAVVDGGWPLPARVAAVATLAAAHLVVAARRVAPVATFAITSLVMLLAVLAPDLESATAATYDGPVPPIVLPSALLFPVALYTVAAWCSSRTSLLALAVAAAGSAMAVARLWSFDSDNPVGSWPVFLLLAVAGGAVAPWSLGRFRRVRAAYVASLEERARLEEENRERHARELLRQERSRIAREMHDVISHSLAVMVTQAEGGRMVAQQDPGATVAVLETVARTGQEAMRGMRGLLDALDPAAPSQAEPSQPPQPTLADLPALLDRVRASGLTVELDEQGSRVRLGGTEQLVAYRVVQESLTNALKHVGPPARVHLTLRWSRAALAIGVRSAGAPAVQQPPASGRGLAGLRERVSLVGGTFEAGPEGDEFVVEATIPAEEELR